MMHNLLDGGRGKGGVCYPYVYCIMYKHILGWEGQNINAEGQKNIIENW